MSKLATFKEVSALIHKHLEERDWHNNPPRSIAISIALEAAELLEHYQWAEDSVGNKEEVASEIADIFIYGFQLSQIYDINIPDAIEHKLKKTAAKYPAGAFKGKSKEEQGKVWIDAKLKHKKGGL